jgi:thiol-disulfide isomerase/thioredoxin
MKHFCGTEMVCVQDFCGNGTFQGNMKYQINMWADWCPSCKGIQFGGYWDSIPNLPYETEPDFDNCPIIKAHIAKHEPYCEKRYQEWINNPS